MDKRESTAAGVGGTARRTLQAYVNVELRELLVLNPVNPRSMSAPLLNSPWSLGGNQIAPPDSAGEVEDTSPLRVMAFKLGLILVFIRFSIIHQLLTSLVHVNFYLLYLFGIPALLGVALAGGV